MLIAGLQPLEAVASPCLWRGCGGKHGHLHPGAARQQGCGAGFRAMLNPAEGQLINSRIPLSQGEHQAGGWAVQRGAKLPPPMPRAQTPLSLPSHSAQFWVCSLCCWGPGALSQGCWGLVPCLPWQGPFEPERCLVLTPGSEQGPAPAPRGIWLLLGTIWSRKTCLVQQKADKPRTRSSAEWCICPSIPGIVVQALT